MREIKVSFRIAIPDEATDEQVTTWLTGVLSKRNSICLVRCAGGVPRVFGGKGEAIEWRDVGQEGSAND